jgi:hypothetical protein
MSDHAPKRRWFQFSLRTLFAAIMLVAICWLVYENWLLRHVVRALDRQVQTEREARQTPPK